MPRTRRLLISALAFALLFVFSTGALAEKAIKKVDPTVKVNKNSFTIRPGIDTEMTLTLSMPGFLSVRTLDKDGGEIETLFTDREYPSGPSSFAWNCARQDDGSFYPDGEYRLGFTLRDEYGNVSKETTIKIKTGEPRPVVSNVQFSNDNKKKPWTFTADLSMAGSVRLDIFNATNLDNSIYEIDGIDKAKAGTVTVAWDGKIVEKEDNKVVDSYSLSPGNYAVRVVLTDKDDEESDDEPIFITVVDDKNMTPYLTGTEPEIPPEPEEEPAPEEEDDDDADDNGDDAETKDAKDDGKDDEKTPSKKTTKDADDDDDRTIGKAIKNDINVRSKPTTGKKGVRITRLRLNETATILETVTGEDGETWYYIHTRGGDEGYVLASLIEIQ